MAGRYLLYVALMGDEDRSAEFDTIDEVVDAVSELTRKTFENNHRMVTFSVGDMIEVVVDNVIPIKKEETDGTS